MTNTKAIKPISKQEFVILKEIIKGLQAECQYRDKVEHQDCTDIFDFGIFENPKVDDSLIASTYSNDFPLACATNIYLQGYGGELLMNYSDDMAPEDSLSLADVTNALVRLAKLGRTGIATRMQRNFVLGDKVARLQNKMDIDC